MIRTALILCFFASLCACGLLGSGSNYYRNAEVLPRTQLPPGIEARAIQDLYPVPDADRFIEPEGDYVVPQPESLVANTENEVRAFRSGNQYWLSTRSTPAETWAKVRRFWEINNIGLATEVPRLGVMETIWLSRTIDGMASQDKFRIRVEHGMHENSSEVYIMHLGFPADASLPSPEQLDWSQVKEDDEVAVAIMQEIATYLLETEYEGASASLLAQSFTGSPKSSMVTDAQGNRLLLLALNYDRAWDVIGKAIEDARMEVVDRDRSAATYYVAYSPQSANEDKEPGFFSFLRFGRGNKEPARNYLVRLQQGSSSEAGQIVVTVQGNEPEAILAEKVLLTIRENLI